MGTGIKGLGTDRTQLEVMVTEAANAELRDMVESSGFQTSVALTYDELLELRQLLNVRVGNTSFGARNSTLDVKLFEGQQRIAVLQGGTQSLTTELTVGTMKAWT